MKKITFIITTTWDTLFGRPHHMASLFKQDGYEVRVVDLANVVRRMYQKFSNRNMYKEQLKIPTKRYAFSYFVPRNMARRLRLHPYFSKESFSKFLFDHVGEAFSEDTIIWIQGVSLLYDPPSFKKLPNCLLISDIEDDYKYFYKDHFHKAIQEIEDGLATNADLIFTTAQSLYDKLATMNPTTYIVPNGADENFIHVAEKTDLSRPNDMPDGAIIGFEGAIANWLDFDLLYDLAGNLDRAKLVLIGKLSVSLDRRLFDKLTSLPNVIYLGEKPYNLLSRYIYHFDVGIIPFSISALTRAVHPNKLYEYLACGVPVVSVALPEVMRYQQEGILTIAESGRSFVNSVKKMMEYRDNAYLIQKRTELTRNNTWRVRYQMIKTIIQQQLDAKGIKV